MIWNQLSLRRRILLGYGLGLVIMSALVVFLLFRLERLNTQVAALNANAAAEAELGAQLAASSAQAQQAVNAYLRQPQASTRAQATQALDALASDLALRAREIRGSSAEGLTAEFGKRLSDYQTTFNTIDSLLKLQKTQQITTNRATTQANTIIGQQLVKSLGATSSTRLTVLLTAQSNVQSAILAISHMLAEQSPQQADLALAGLNLARLRLESIDNPTETNFALREALNTTKQSISATLDLSNTLTKLEILRSTELNARSEALQGSANTIARDSLTAYTNASASVEQQMHQIEQASVLALGATLGFALLLGLRLARALTRPLDTLLAATERIAQGNYQQAVASREGGEFGKLMTAFERMRVTLGQQRAEVEQQQAAMVSRNNELEQALTQLQRATAEREALATTVRTLSVPIIPILKHVLVVPLVGELELDRAHIFTQRLLEGVTNQRARLAIIDITGVAMLDPAVVRWLLNTAAALRLLGAQTMLAGVNPEVAQALVASGADLSELDVAPDLRAAVALAMRTIPN